MIAAGWNASGMNLREAGIGKRSATFVGAKRSGNIRSLGIGRKVVNIAVAPSRQNHGVGRPRVDRIP